MNDFQERYLAENQRLTELAKRLNASIEQPVDLDGPVVRCGCAGCGRDAVLVIRMRVGTPSEFLLAACRKHRDAARDAAAQVTT